MCNHYAWSCYHLDCGPAIASELEHLLDVFAVEVFSFTPDQAALAVDAWQRFRKSRHPAGLNISDGCSYALAAHARRPLLAVGGDFARTDVELVDMTANVGSHRA